MTHRRMANVSGLFLVLCICHLPFSFCHAATPNIIHIVADDVGYDDLSCYGAKKIQTPNLDRLASQGMRFTSFYAPAPTCTPTRAALMTGCYAQRVGLPSVLFPSDNIGLADSEITIAELLKARGYATGLIGKWHLGHHVEHLPTRHGFDLFFGIPYPNDHGPERDRSKKEQVPFPPIPLFRNEKIVEQPAVLETCPDRFADEAIKFISDNKDKRFFLHLANIETHTPWFVPKRFENQSSDGAYGDAVQCLDAMVGRIMETLDQLHLAENTLLVFTSDNGPLWQRGADLERIYGKYGTVDPSRPHVLRAGKYQSRWEGGTRVPAIVRWPGKVAAGKTCDALAAGFDLYNTFAAVGGAEVSKDRVIDGVDLEPILTGDANAKPAHEFIYYYAGYGLTGVRSGEWKLVFPGRPPPHEKETLLFNVQNDPGETKDFTKAHPEIVERLQKIAEAARDDLGDDRTEHPGKNRRAPSELAPG